MEQLLPGLEQVRPAMDVGVRMRVLKVHRRLPANWAAAGLGKELDRMEAGLSGRRDGRIHRRGSLRTRQVAHLDAGSVRPLRRPPLLLAQAARKEASEELFPLRNDRMGAVMCLAVGLEWLIAGLVAKRRTIVMRTIYGRGRGRCLLLPAVINND